MTDVEASPSVVTLTENSSAEAVGALTTLSRSPYGVPEPCA